MTRIIDRQLLLFLAVVGCLLMRSREFVRAQESPGLKTVSQSDQSGLAVTRDPSGITRIKCERGVKITVGNRTTGPIIVTGWDRDFIEASAVSDLGVEAVRVNLYPDPSGDRILVKADYAESDVYLARQAQEIRAYRRLLRERRQLLGMADSESAQSVDRSSQENQPPVKADVPMPPPAPPQIQDPYPSYYFRPREIFLEVKVPRQAEIDPIKVFRSQVLVSGVETPVVVDGEKSAIKLVRVGAAEVRTRSGDVEVEDVAGLVDVITTSGAIVVRNAGSDVRALSLSGRIEIQCARGRVDVSNTDGPITLNGVSGDASATATYSHVRFSGPIRADGRYFLKSMSGAVEMEAPANGPGFTASLSSYRGGVETDFSLKTRQAATNKGNKGNTDTSPVNRRLIGRYGNGQAQITLDSFDGKVRLGRMAAGALKDCR
jgi:hypothetical protein